MDEKLQFEHFSFMLPKTRNNEFWSCFVARLSQDQLSVAMRWRSNIHFETTVEMIFPIGWLSSLVLSLQF
jgi:hypothetical protein